MLGFFKVLGRGVLYTVLLPFILLIWALFTVYCVILFIVMFFRNIVIWISGGSPFGDTKEDVEAKRILTEQQNQQQNAASSDAYKDALIATLANAVAQQNQKPVNNVPEFDVFPTNEIEHQEPNQIEQFLEEKGDENK